MSQAKMTPGPWHASNLWLGPEGKGPYAYPLGTNPDEAAANARAIACLPELVEAARNLVGGASQGVLAVDIDNLRRILARIDGNDCGL